MSPRAVFAASGYGARGGFGKRPALLVIDVNYAFCGDKPEPILESIKRWRNSCGEDSVPAPGVCPSCGGTSEDFLGLGNGNPEVFGFDWECPCGALLSEDDILTVAEYGQKL